MTLTHGKLVALLLALSGAVVAAQHMLPSTVLFDLVIQTDAVSTVGELTIVPVKGGTFDGPKLRGTIVGPSGDWIVRRRDGSNALDVRMLLQTEDGEKIYMNWHGISYAPAGGAQYARILPTFEANPGKYEWLNHIVAVGVYRPTPGKVVYRVYQVL
jgi:hypothetical protein